MLLRLFVPFAFSIRLMGRFILSSAFEQMFNVQFLFSIFYLCALAGLSERHMQARLEKPLCRLKLRFHL